MKTAGYVIIGLLAVGALAFYIRAQVGFPHVQIPTVASLVGTSTAATGSALSASVASANVQGEYVDLTGTILLDTTGGTSVPFIQYIDTKNHVATKQLVYADSRACAAYAGDLPCVDMNPNAAYPQYPTGTRIRVRGQHVADRVLVFQIDPL
ncbi:MAG: hypothetical protein JWL88_548 [Parcubacteria group bacterium]|nr:hypothetical protein [Parcubacteria group bacterium]